jgi:hypothetical protein
MSPPSGKWPRDSGLFLKLLSSGVVACYRIVSMITFMHHDDGSWLKGSSKVVQGLTAWCRKSALPRLGKSTMKISWPGTG